MEKKIYTMRAEIRTDGFVSIEAANIVEARALFKKLSDADALQVNIEAGSGTTELMNDAFEDDTPDDGTHMMQTPRANAAENADALFELSEDDE